MFQNVPKIFQNVPIFCSIQREKQSIVENSNIIKEMKLRNLKVKKQRKFQKV